METDNNRLAMTEGYFGSKWGHSTDKLQYELSLTCFI